VHEVLSHWCWYQVICVHQVLSHWGCYWTQALFWEKKQKSSLNVLSHQKRAWTWCTTSAVTRGAKVLSHQNIHTYITLHYSTLHYITLYTLHYITLHYITIHYITLRYITLHSCTGLGAQNRMSPEGPKSYGIRTYILTLPYIALHYITSHHSTVHYSTLRYITYMQRCTKLYVTRGA